MSRQNGQGLKWLLETIPTGFIVDSNWLRSSGISRQSVSKYIDSGWLERIAHAVYRRPDQNPRQDSDDCCNWETLVLSLQHVMHYEIHVGGITALEKHGYSHYVSIGEEKKAIFLYGQKMPAWLKSIQAGASFELRKRKLFTDLNLGLDHEVSSGKVQEFSSPWNWRMTMSGAERSILEAMDELPNGAAFHTVDMIFQSLANLRPRLVMKLLLSCTSKKVKRLFFVFADRHGHSWRTYIDENQVELGSGDRALVRGGKLHPKYRIVVPEWLLKSENRETDEP